MTHEACKILRQSAVKHLRRSNRASFSGISSMWGDASEIPTTKKCTELMNGGDFDADKVLEFLSQWAPKH